MKIFFHKLSIAFFVVSVIVFSYNESYTIIPKVSGLLLLAVYLSTLVDKYRIPLVTRETWIIIAWLFLSAIASIYALDMDVSLKRLFTLLQLFPVVFSLYVLITSSRLVTFTLCSIVITTLLVSIPTVLTPEKYSILGRAMATLNNPNLYGYVLLVSIISCVRLGLYTSRASILAICLLLSLFFTYMLVETASRKAFISLFVSLFILSYLYVKSMPSNKKLLSIVVIISFASVLIGASIILLNKSAKGYRINHLLTAVASKDISKAEGSDRGRLMMYQTGFKSLLRNPLGVGLDNFRNLKLKNTSQNIIGTYSHSNYIEVAVCTGFLGFIVYYYFYFSIILRLYKLRNNRLSKNNQALYDICVSLIVLTLIYDFAMVSYYEKLTWIVLAAVYAETIILSKNRKHKRRNIIKYHYEPSYTSS